MFLILGLALAGCGGGDDSSAADASPTSDAADTIDGDIGEVDAGDESDASPETDAGVGVSCGPEFCDPGTEKCCVQAEQGGGTTETCIPTGDNCAGGADLTCDGPEDCASPEVCCGSLVGGGGAACAAVEDCDGAGDLILCGTADDCPEAEPHCCANPVLAASTCQSIECAP
jgi:hypothetical protein